MVPSFYRPNNDYSYNQYESNLR